MHKINLKPTGRILGGDETNWSTAGVTEMDSAIFFPPESEKFLPPIDKIEDSDSEYEVENEIAKNLSRSLQW